MLSDILKIHVCLFVCLFVSSLKRNRNRTEDAQKLLEKRMSALNDSLQTLSQEVSETGTASAKLAHFTHS